MRPGGQGIISAHTLKLASKGPRAHGSILPPASCILGTHVAKQKQKPRSGSGFKPRVQRRPLIRLWGLAVDHAAGTST